MFKQHVFMALEEKPLYASLVILLSLVGCATIEPAPPLQVAVQIKKLHPEQDNTFCFLSVTVENKMKVSIQPRVVPRVVSGYGLVKPLSQGSANYAVMMPNAKQTLDIHLSDFRCQQVQKLELDIYDNLSRSSVKHTLSW